MPCGALAIFLPKMSLPPSLRTNPDCVLTACNTVWIGVCPCPDGETNTLDRLLDMTLDDLPPVKGRDLREEVVSSGNFGVVLCEPSFLNMFA